MLIIINKSKLYHNTIITKENVVLDVDPTEIQKAFSPASMKHFS